MRRRVKSSRAVWVPPAHVADPTTYRLLVGHVPGRDGYVFRRYLSKRQLRYSFAVSVWDDVDSVRPQSRVIEEQSVVVDADQLPVLKKRLEAQLRR